MATATEITLSVLSLAAVVGLLLLLPQPRESLVCLKALDDAAACMERDCAIAFPRPLSFEEGRVCCGEICFKGNVSVRGTFTGLVCEGGECEGTD